MSTNRLSFAEERMLFALAHVAGYWAEDEDPFYVQRYADVKQCLRDLFNMADALVGESETLLFDYKADSVKITADDYDIYISIKPCTEYTGRIRFPSITIHRQA